MTLADGAALIALVQLEGWPSAERDARADALPQLRAKTTKRASGCSCW
jgi:hypothetical protein